ncbi:DUF4230 domain-containing protein [Intrasporangium calvum]|uniref:DUF4230 domain-containing protein n=1 Tax=Intrasporangium calvum TaxID=53358 RepID=A0ABT5GE66_9MICO|nr:DUF4230 domain-containing protein [Intrasporangium calvum]MDC5696545.1 DUF4230 domain-containing protein [Intrasporangium calvum]
MASSRLRGVARVIGGALVGALALIGIAGAMGWLPFQTRTTDHSQPVLLQSIQNLSQYHAAVGTFEVVVDVEDDVNWVPDFIAGERSLFVAHGTVNAYVDFSDLAGDDLTLSEDGKAVTVRIPEPQLDKPNLDMERTRLFSQDRGIYNRLKDAISPKDQQKVYLLAEQKIAAAAAESELRAQAAVNTKQSLTELFNSLGLTATIEQG